MGLEDKRTLLAAELTNPSLGIPLLEPVSGPPGTVPVRQEPEGGAPSRRGDEPQPRNEELLLLHLIHDELVKIHETLYAIGMKMPGPKKDTPWPWLVALVVYFLILTFALIVRG